MLMRFGALVLFTATIAACSNDVAVPQPTQYQPDYTVKNYTSPDPPEIYFGINFTKEREIYAPFAGIIHVIYFKNSQGDYFAEIDLSAEDVPQSKATDKSSLSLYTGKVGTDVNIFVKEGDKVKEGNVLFRVIGFGPSGGTYFLPPGAAGQILGYWVGPSGQYLKLANGRDWKLLLP